MVLLRERGSLLLSLRDPELTFHARSLLFRSAKERLAVIQSVPSTPAALSEALDASFLATQSTEPPIPSRMTFSPSSSSFTLPALLPFGLNFSASAPSSPRPDLASTSEVAPSPVAPHIVVESRSTSPNGVTASTHRSPSDQETGLHFAAAPPSSRPWEARSTLDAATIASRSGSIVRPVVVEQPSD